MEEGNRTGATVDDSLVQLAREGKLKPILFYQQKAKIYESFPSVNANTNVYLYCKAKKNLAKKF
jgi:hypothetical protein